jgi:hypothetical protein
MIPSHSFALQLLLLCLTLLLLPQFLTAENPQNSTGSTIHSTVLSNNIDCLPNFTDRISLICKIAAAALLYFSIGIMIIFLQDVKLGFLVGWIIFIQQLVTTGAKAISGLQWSGIVGTIIANIYLILSVVNLDVTYVKAGCNIPAYDFVVFFWSTMIFFLIVIALFTLCAIIYALRLTAEQISADNCKSRYSAWRKRQLHALFMFGALIYLQCTQRMFRAIACQDINGVSVLIIENSTRCWQGAHYSVAIFSIFFIILYSVGFPLLCLYYLKKIWGPRLAIMKIKEEQEKNMKKAIKQLQTLKGNQNYASTHRTATELQATAALTPRTKVGATGLDWQNLEATDKNEQLEQAQWEILENQAKAVRETTARRNLSVMKAAMKLRIVLKKIRQRQTETQPPRKRRWSSLLRSNNKNHNGENLGTRSKLGNVGVVPPASLLTSASSDGAVAKQHTTLPQLETHRFRSEPLKTVQNFPHFLNNTACIEEKFEISEELDEKSRAPEGSEDNLPSAPVFHVTENETEAENERAKDVEALSSPPARSELSEIHIDSENEAASPNETINLQPNNTVNTAENLQGNHNQLNHESKSPTSLSSVVSSVVSSAGSQAKYTSDPLFQQRLRDYSTAHHVVIPSALIESLVDPNTAKDFYFLYRGCRPEVYWFRNMNFLVNFTLAIQSSFTTSPSIQTFIAGLIFLSYFTAGGYLKPFRSTFENTNALIGGSVNTGQCLIFLFLIAVSSTSQQNAGNIIYTIVLLGCIVVALLLVLVHRNGFTVKKYVRLVWNNPRDCCLPCIQHKANKKQQTGAEEAAKLKEKDGNPADLPPKTVEKSAGGSQAKEGDEKSLEKSENHKELCMDSVFFEGLGKEENIPVQLAAIPVFLGEDEVNMKLAQNQTHIEAAQSRQNSSNSRNHSQNNTANELHSIHIQQHN